MYTEKAVNSWITASSIAHELTDFPVLVTTETRPQLAVDPGLNKTDTVRRSHIDREKTASSRPTQWNYEEMPEWQPNNTIRHGLVNLLQLWWQRHLTAGLLLNPQLHIWPVQLTHRVGAWVVYDRWPRQQNKNQTGTNLRPVLWQQRRVVLCPQHTKLTSQSKSGTQWNRTCKTAPKSPEQSQCYPLVRQH